MSREKSPHDLDDRKVRILSAIIKTYLDTGEPVGSRTISKYTDLNLSSATIRNEMSDLEDLGYILQPHTSAGRIPSDKGYRFYVDHLMEEKEREVTEMKEFVIRKTENMERVLKSVAKMLADNTKYATVVSAPSFPENTIKFIQLSQMDEHQILAVVVTNSNRVRNQMIEVEEPLDNETVLKLNILLNSALNGKAIHDINLATISRLKEQAGIHSQLVSDVIDALAVIIGGEEEVEIFTSGATNILKYPELTDFGGAENLISTFEDKRELVDLVIESLSESDEEPGTGIQVYIGNETPVRTMKNCSVVTATYELGDGVKGTIGIVGPKRMDYENVVSNLKMLKSQLDDAFKKKT